MLEVAVKGSRAGTRVVVIPDSDLGRIPLEVLSPAEGEFVGDRYPVVYSPSAGVLRYQRRSKEGERETVLPRRALLVGDPVYRGGDGDGPTVARMRDDSPRSKALRAYRLGRGLGQVR